VVGGRIVPGVVQVPDVQIVSTEGIGRNGTFGSFRGGSIGGVMMVVMLRSHGSTADGESGRSGQDKKSHDRILVFCF
jgi:hypothetical protein